MNKLNSFIIAILSTSLVLPTAYAVTLHQISNQPNRALANNTLSPTQIRQLAQAVSVKVLSNNKGGSGVLISKQGQTYTIITNAHVISNKGTYRIQTPDGKTYTATVINQGNSLKGNDLAVLQFQSQAKYQIIPLASNSNLAENQEVFAAGFPDDSKEIVVTNGKISLLSKQPLVGGYQIGYTNEIRQGMSGGSLLNQSGQLIGINGLLNNAILNEAYFYQNGSKPSAEQLQQLRQLSFAVPIQTLAKVAPNLAIIPPEWRNQQQLTRPAGNTFVDKVDSIAQQITVRIDSQNSGNGSGVIIAKQGDTYYVVTALHVVKNPDTYQIIAPDGKQYVVQQSNIFKSEGLDAAVVKFTSNQTYSVATIAKYNLYSDRKIPWIFLSGFPQEAAGKRKLTAGLRSYGRGTIFIHAESLDYLNNIIDAGYELGYTNLTKPGMSGGAVLNAIGQVIGINTSIEPNGIGEKEELGLGLGVPINSIFGLLKKSGLKPELLKVVTQAPPKLTETEINTLKNHPLFVAQKPSQNPTEYDWLNYGNQLWRLEKYPESVAALQQAIKLKQNFYEAYLALGLAQYAQEKYPQALVAYEQAIKIKPDSDKVWLSKYSTLNELQKYPEALVAIDKAIEYNSSDVDLYLQRGIALRNLKRYPEALAAVTKAIEMKPLFFLYLVRGNLYSQLKNYQAALADSNQAIKLQPDDAINYRSRGIVYFNLKNYQAALADLNQAIKLEPDDAINYSLRGDVYSQLKNYQAALANYNQAIKLYSQEIKLQPDDASNYSSRGDVYFGLKNNQAALADLNQAIKLQPDDADSYRSRGNVYFNLKNYQAALADLNQVIKLQPDNASNYSLRGIVYSRLKNYQAALADYNQVIKLQPDDASNYRSRGDVYSQLKNNQAALADYNQAIKLQPDDASNYRSRGKVYSQLKNNQAALADFNQAIKLQPDDASNYSSRGKVYSQLKNNQAALADYNQAIKLYSQAIKLQPDDGSNYIFRGDVYFNLKNNQAALADFNQAIKLQPDDALYYVVRSSAYFELKDYQAALADYSQIIKLQPDNANAYFGRGVINQKQGSDRAALSDYNQAIAKDGKLVAPIINIGYIKYEKGDVEGAIQQWEKAVQINGKLAEPQMAIAVALYAKGEQEKALNMAQSALRLDKSFANVNVLKENLWGTHLVAEAQKLLSHPTIQALRTKQ
ncbi:MAG: tetratricopeptide repeat protein [Nostoc sp.]|uniref:tetratricopeptide repeat protein n=1 Tax=Nostoc sp. TaxID=1180 RepID=UPI002FF6294C